MSKCSKCGDELNSAGTCYNQCYNTFGTNLQQNSGSDPIQHIIVETPCHCEELEKELDEYRKIGEDEHKALNEKMQECGRLKKELNETIQNGMEHLKTNISLIQENEKYIKALKWISTTSKDEHAVNLAGEALEGVE